MSLKFSSQVRGILEMEWNGNSDDALSIVDAEHRKIDLYELSILKILSWP